LLQASLSLKCASEVTVYIFSPDGACRNPAILNNPVSSSNKVLRPSLQVYGFIHSLWLDLQFQSPPLMFGTHMAAYNLTADGKKIAELAAEPIE
jgi:hypothetical protein